MVVWLPIPTSNRMRIWRTKRAIMPGLQSWATNTMTMEILAQYGITYNDIISNGGKVEHVGYDDMQRGMADRQVDFIAAFQGYPTALWINAHNSRPIRLLPVTEEVAYADIGKYSWFILISNTGGNLRHQPRRKILQPSVTLLL